MYAYVHMFIYIYAYIGWYSALKIKLILSFAVTWIKLQDNIVSELSPPQSDDAVLLTCGF